jgi:hypothetical protein
MEIHQILSLMEKDHSKTFKKDKKKIKFRLLFFMLINKNIINNNLWDQL